MVQLLLLLAITLGFAAGTCSPSVVDVALRYPKLQTLVGLLQQVDLVGALQAFDRYNPVTVFAPTDDAFGNLGPDGVAQGLPNNTLIDLLTYHVVPGSYPEKALNQKNILETLERSSDHHTSLLKVESFFGRVTLDDGRVATSQSISACNGECCLSPLRVSPLAL
jgi:uncharacterized surface protein with fasciclin (FAS1) repeats